MKVRDWGENGFSVKASKAFLPGRLRLEAALHNPAVATINRHLAKTWRRVSQLCQRLDTTFGFPVGTNGFRHKMAWSYRDSADLLEVSPDLKKRFADCRFGDDFRGRVKSGWILIACSGQVYGIIGSAVLATEVLNDQVVSNHVLRVAPRKGSVPAGYILTALTHPIFGRPLLKALAFGSSIPEIDSDDLQNLPIVRLNGKAESEIAELAEASAKARAQADILELEIAADAELIVSRFITHGKL